LLSVTSPLPLGAGYQYYPAPPGGEAAQQPQRRPLYKRTPALFLISYTMAYRKRTTLKKRSRVAKRVIRRTRRVKKIRRNKRVSATRVYHVTETIDTADILMGIVPSNILSSCKLTDFPRIAAMRQFFQEYKIRSFTTIHTPKQQAQFWTGPLGSLQATAEPLIAITYPNAISEVAAGVGSGGIANYNEAMNQQGARKHSLQRPIVRKVPGMILQQQNLNVADRAIRSPWQRLYDGTGGLVSDQALMIHHGVGVYLPALLSAPAAGNAAPGFTTVKTISVSFRGKKVL
jgi:hypothetical protein